MLQEAIKNLPEDEAKYHMKRCVDSGLWVPEANKSTYDDGDEKDTSTATSEEIYEEVPATSSNPKIPVAIIEDVD